MNASAKPILTEPSVPLMCVSAVCVFVGLSLFFWVAKPQDGLSFAWPANFDVEARWLG